METVLHVGLSNALAATVLAVLVAAVAFCCRRPALLHSFWLLVLLRLLIPPFFEVPIPWPHVAPAMPTTETRALAIPSEPVLESHVTDLPDAAARRITNQTATDLSAAVEARSGSMVRSVSPLEYWKQAVFGLWLTGSVVWIWLAWRRFRRFSRLVRCARPATRLEQEQIRRLADQLGLCRCPSVCFVPAAVSPTLCAFVGSPRLCLPIGLWDRLTQEQRDTLLVHELAHLRRRDHWVRRLEFGATALYWWHPVLWWARRQIQEAEEQCCDAWVASLLPAAIPAYAETLVATVTFLSRARSALPLGASGMGHAHLLRRRLLMITRGTTPKDVSAGGLVVLAMLGAVVLLLVPTWAQTSGSQPQDKNTQENEFSSLLSVPRQVARDEQPDPFRTDAQGDKENDRENRSAKERRPAPVTAQAQSQLGRPDQKRIRVPGRRMPWKQALDWLGKESGMTVIATFMPDGNFNVFGPSLEYTIPELVDLMNNQLKMDKKPCLLVRGKNAFQLIPYEFNKPVDTNLPRVTVKELEQHGQTELVILDIPLETIPAAEIAKELNRGAVNNRMLGPLGKAFAVPNSNVLVVRDTVQNLKIISQILLQAEETEKKNCLVYKHKCIYVKAEDAERILKDLLGVALQNQPDTGQPGQSGQPVAQRAAKVARAPQKNAVHVSSDRASNTVFVRGPPAKIELAKKTMEELDDARKGQPAIVTGPPIVKTYKISGVAADVAKALKEIRFAECHGLTGRQRFDHGFGLSGGPGGDSQVYRGSQGPEHFRSNPAGKLGSEEGLR